MAGAMLPPRTTYVWYAARREAMTSTAPTTTAAHSPANTRSNSLPIAVRSAPRYSLLADVPPEGHDGALVAERVSRRFRQRDRNAQVVGYSGRQRATHRGAALH